jgi:aprataxin and PNK-like factor
MFSIDLLKLKFLLFASFSKARDELKEKRGVEYSYPVLAFHGTAVANIQPICETGFKIPG